ncbi:rano class II histocompatibility antigen, D-1 beta chain-like [Cololabis saira]|uniref:rano class II histocompatibility antigen, D-1 beta chain-like n=1 Tax=Cololabis saira TaxID=129043 RepID=UPI002AD20587|nr:rano class II histocompatibility antigen, D-1 beta chain-like [Cololabis saira]
MDSTFIRVCLLFITISTADAMVHHFLRNCEFNSSKLEDIEFILSMYYDKVEFLRFTSSSGKFVGYTEFGVKQADYFNKDAAQMSSWRAQKESVCVHNIDMNYSNILDKSVEPKVKLRSTAPPPGQHPAMLVCSAYDFYPKNIKMTWFRDGQEVKTSVSYTDELADGDWYYQYHSHLEYTPRSGEKISCVVHHVSLKEALKIDWDPSMPESERNKIAIGASGLILGLVLSLAGFIYYKRKARGRILVPSN